MKKKKVKLLKRSSGKSLSKSKKSIKKLPGRFRSRRVAFLAIVIFAAVASAFNYFILAQGEYPTGADDVVLEYRQEKPQIVTLNDKQAVSQLEAGTFARVLGDGTIECSAENSNELLTGKMPGGQLKQLFKEVNTGGIRNLPDEQFMGNDTENFVGNLESITVNSSENPKVVILNRGVPHDDIFDKVVSTIRKRCEQATTKKTRSEQVKTKRDKVTQKRDSLLNKLSMTETASAVTSGYIQSYEDAQANSINSHRAAHYGRRALARSRCLTDVARIHAKRMAVAGYIYHNPNIVNEVNYACGGSTTGYWYKLGENVGVTSGTSAGLFDAFIASPAHHANVDDNDWNLMGVGAYQSSSGQKWVVQLYANCPGCSGPWTASPTNVGDPEPLVRTPPKYFKWDTSTNRKPASADFNGDGKLDAGMWSAYSGRWFSPAFASSIEFGQAGDVPIPGDYNDDGKDDLAVWRKSNATFYLRGIGTTTYGRSTDVPVPADYNGDGKTDIAVFRAADGKWYIKGIGSGGANVAITFGIVQNDIPLPGDYNGDGKADLGLFRASSHAWFAKTIGGTYIINNSSYGASTDIPVPADYDGDKKLNRAVWRPSNKVWYLLNIANSTAFGLAAGDIPAPGDYNHDGKAEIAVLRQDDNTIYYRLNPTDAGTNGSIKLAP